VVNVIVSCVELTNVAACPTPLYVTVELATNPVPVSVNVCALAPATTDGGDRLTTFGAGLLTAKFSGLEVPPPGTGFVTTTG
jgi:hypothetical protein